MTIVSRVNTMICKIKITDNLPIYNGIISIPKKIKNQTISMWDVIINDDDLRINENDTG